MSPRGGETSFTIRGVVSSEGLSREERMFSQRLHNYRWNVTHPSDRRASNRRERGNAYLLTIRRQSLWPLPRCKLVNHVMRLSEITPTCPRGCQSTWGLSGSPDHPSDYDVRIAQRKTFYPLWHEVLFVISRVHQNREAGTPRLLSLRARYSKERSGWSRYAICNYDTCNVSGLSAFQFHAAPRGPIRRLTRAYTRQRNRWQFSRRNGASHSSVILNAILRARARVFRGNILRRRNSWNVSFNRFVSSSPWNRKENTSLGSLPRFCFRSENPEDAPNWPLTSHPARLRSLYVARRESR